MGIDFLSHRWRGFYIALVIGLATCGSAFAADMPMPTKAPIIAPPPVIESWTFSLTPYLWATSLKGSTTVKGYTTDVDASFIDLLEHTKIPVDLFQLAALGEARYGRFAVLTDFTYMKLGINANETKSHNFGGPLGPGVNIGASLGLDIKMFIAEVAAAYEVLKLSPNTAVDLYAGGRFWWQSGDASLVVTPGPISRTLSGTIDWVDPVVGARLRHQFSPRWSMFVSGDVGGFDVGSKFSWQALGAVNYEFAKTKNVTWSGMLGYKALYADYSKGSGLSHYEYNMTLYGPVFAITAKF